MGYPCIVISSSLPLSPAHCFPTPKAHSECSMPSAASVPPLSSFFPDFLISSLERQYKPLSTGIPQALQSPKEVNTDTYLHVASCMIMACLWAFLFLLVFFLTNGFKTKGIPPVNVIMCMCLYKPTGIVLPISLLMRKWESLNTKAWRWKHLCQDAASSLKAKRPASETVGTSDTIYLKEKLFSNIPILSKRRPALRNDSSIQKSFLHGIPLIPGTFGKSNLSSKWLSQQPLAMTLTSAFLRSGPVCHNKSLSLVSPELLVPSQLLRSGDCLISAMI